MPWPAGDQQLSPVSKVCCTVSRNKNTPQLDGASVVVFTCYPTTHHLSLPHSRPPLPGGTRITKACGLKPAMRRSRRPGPGQGRTSGVQEETLATRRQNAVGGRRHRPTWRVLRRQRTSSSCFVTSAAPRCLFRCSPIAEISVSIIVGLTTR